MHVKNIVHRDLKPENILLEHKENDKLEIKISDFGFACFFDPDNGLETVLGSTLYMAPELIRRENYDEKVDIWAIGVIAYMLLTGRSPFPGQNKDQTKKLILWSEINWNSHFMQKLDPGAVNFIQCAMERDVKKRYTAKALLNHEWLVRKSKEID